MFSFYPYPLLLHVETMDATGSENESKELNMNASISPYNCALHRLESVTDSTSCASIVSICKDKDGQEYMYTIIEWDWTSCSRCPDTMLLWSHNCRRYAVISRIMLNKMADDWLEKVSRLFLARVQKAH